VTTGSITKDSTIVKSSSPGYRHVKDIFALLEEWKIVIRVDVILSRMSKIGSMAPKRFLFDHGVRNYFTPLNLNMADADYVRSEFGEGIIEQFILTELTSLNLTGKVDCWMATHQSGEVDFLFSFLNKIFAIEVKSAKKLNLNHLTSLMTLKEMRPEVNAILTNLSQGELFQSRIDKIPILPAYQLFNYLSSLQ